MTQKTFSQKQDLVSVPQFNPRLLIVLGATILLIIIALVGINNGSRASESAGIGQTAVIPYSNALELQYAQPYLTGNGAANAAVIPYSNALELQYAQPHLTGNTAANGTAGTSFSDSMAMQYAQPWIDQQVVPGISNFPPIERVYDKTWYEE